MSQISRMYVPENVKQEFLRKKNVVGVGIGYKVSAGVQIDVPAIVALVSQKEAKSNLYLEDLIPRFANGLIATDVVEVGDIKALGYTQKYRPAPGGVSIGHYKITAGTLGSLVRSSQTNQVLILSNNHVLANSNDALLGDPILQPGPVDGGKMKSDEIGTLLRYIPINFGEEPGVCSWAEGYAQFGNLIAKAIGSRHRVNSYRYNPQAVNYVDAAVATPYNPSDIQPMILEIGVVGGTAEAFLGMGVRKTGRTTEHTVGNITLIGATVQVQYGNKKATFDNQILTGAMSQGGDSGSLLVGTFEDDLRAVGLLFAGSNVVTIYNPIQAVVDALGIVI